MGSLSDFGFSLPDHSDDLHTSGGVITGGLKAPSRLKAVHV